MSTTATGLKVRALIDPWDTQDPAAYPPRPVKTYVITHEMRAKDAAKQAACQQPVGSGWAAKDSLSLDNLRRKLPPKQIQPKRITKPKPTPTPKPLEEESMMPTKSTRNPTKERKLCKPRCPQLGVPDVQALCGTCGLDHRTAEERELDDVWFQLSVADKAAVLQEALEA